jgi:hypothetical protein
MGLVLKRTDGQQIQIDLDPSTSAESLLAQMQDGITITVYECERGGVKLKISAPQCLSIYRPEAYCEQV